MDNMVQHILIFGFCLMLVGGQPVQDQYTQAIQYYRDLLEARVGSVEDTLGSNARTGDAYGRYPGTGQYPTSTDDATDRHFSLVVNPVPESNRDSVAVPEVYTSSYADQYIYGLDDMDYPRYNEIADAQYYSGAEAGKEEVYYSDTTDGDRTVSLPDLSSLAPADLAPIFLTSIAALAISTLFTNRLSLNTTSSNATVPKNLWEVPSIEEAVSNIPFIG